MACIFAQAVARAEASREEDQQALADDYRRRAIDAIAKTLHLLRPEERLSFWRDKIFPDAALAPIHKDARFQRLREEFAGSRPSEAVGDRADVKLDAVHRP